MTKEERDALIASARKTPWLDTMKRRETEALLEALDDAEKRVRDIEDLRARIVSAMSCEPDDDSDLVEAVRENVRERDDAERERDAARAQLAALHAAASAVQTRARALPVSMTEIVHAEEWDDLDRTIADAAPTAAKHKRRVRAKVIAEVLGLYDGTNGCAAADLTPVIKAAQSLETRIRADERVRTDEARRALSIAETKSAGADVIVADAEARRVAAEMRAIQAEGRAERLERELAEARRGYDTVTAALEGGTGDPLASALRRAEKAERERDAARDQLAALHAAAQRFRDAVSDDGLTCRDNGLDSAAAVEEEWEAIDRVLADLATSAAEHERRVRAPVEAERDQFAAALAEVRDAVAAHREAMRYAREDGALEAWATRAKAITDAYERVTRALDAIPADLAAQRESRIRADERAKALREAIERMRDAIYPATVLRAMADEAERGTR